LYGLEKNLIAQKSLVEIDKNFGHIDYYQNGGKKYISQNGHVC
jgi:hypothetical protein